MSQPVLLVDPRDVDLMAFNAMHGGRGSPPPNQGTPSNQSRDNSVHQPHTTFYTADRERWTDNPYYSPLAPPAGRHHGEPTGPVSAQLAGRQVYGEDNAAAVDSEGRVYLASLYAHRNETGRGAWQYAIGFWKSQRVDRPVDYYSGNKLWKAPAGVVIDSIHMGYSPEHNRVAAFWRETNASSPLKSYVNAAWTIPGKGATWTFIREGERVGPCSGSTNPLPYGGLLYFGCFPGAGYALNPTATLTRLQIHALDPSGERWTTRHIDEATIERTASSAHALLVDRKDGRMVAVSGGLSPDGKAFLKVAYGHEGTRWDSADDYSAKLAEILRPPGAKVIEARALAAAFVLRSGNLHVIYKERYLYPDGQQKPGAPEYFKALVSIHTGSERPFNKLVPLGVDAAKDASADGITKGQFGVCQVYSTRHQGTGKQVFNDLHDSLVVWENAAGHQREFVAFGDCGNVRFAEVFEDGTTLFGFALPPGTPPIPTPTAGAAPAQMAAVAGVLATAMVLRMLAFKRKLAVEAPA